MYDCAKPIYELPLPVLAKAVGSGMHDIRISLSLMLGAHLGK